MHRMLFVLISVLASCKAPVDRRATTANGGLSAREFSRLKAINDAQTDSVEGIDRLTKAKNAPCGLDEKRQSMNAGIQDFSVHTKIEPTVRCPVQYLKSWTYDASAQKLGYRHEMKTTRSMKTTYRRAAGEITREGTAINRSIVGAIRYDRIEINGVGLVEAEVTTNQRYTRTKGIGELRVTVRQGDWSHTGVMKWRTGSNQKTVYEVDGHSITAEGFNQLFSAYGLPEIMANSMKMR